MSKNSLIILGLLVVTICWSWAWTNRTSPSSGVVLGSPLAACSVYGDLTCSVHNANNLCLFNCQWHAPIFVIEGHMLDWHTCQICYPLKIKLSLLLLLPSNSSGGSRGGSGGSNEPLLEPKLPHFHGEFQEKLIRPYKSNPAQLIWTPDPKILDPPPNSASKDAFWSTVFEVEGSQCSSRPSRREILCETTATR